MMVVRSISVPTNSPSRQERLRRDALWTIDDRGLVCYPERVDTSEMLARGAWERTPSG